MCYKNGVFPLGAIFEVLVYILKKTKQKEILALFMMLHGSLQFSLYYLETQARLIQL